MINSGREWDWMDKKTNKMSKDKRKEIKVDHPEFGHVIFHGATARQIEVLESLKHTCSIANDVIAQNKMLVDMIGEMESMLRHKDEEIEKLKSAGESPYVDFLN